MALIHICMAYVYRPTRQTVGRVVLFLRVRRVLLRGQIPHRQRGSQSYMAHSLREEITHPVLRNSTQT